MIKKAIYIAYLLIVISAFPFFVEAQKAEIRMSSTSIAFDTILGYTSLRAYTGNSKILVVKDFTYNYNGNTYTTLGGIFYRIPVGTENGGTIIVANNGVVWKRIFDGVTFFPMWWEVGGYGENSEILYTDCRRIDAATRIGGIGATIMYPHNYVFNDCEKTIQPREAQKHIGAKTTVRKKGEIFTILTAPPPAGISIISVASTDGFNIGQGICIKYRNRRKNGFYTNRLVIEGKTANTLTLNNPVPATSETGISLTWSTGDTVIVETSLYSNYPGVVNGSEPIVFSGIEFDGNWRNSKLIASWTKSSLVDVNNYSVIFENCEFVNSTNSSAVVRKAIFNNCRFGATAYSVATEKKLSGGIFHANQDPNTAIGDVALKNCVADSTNWKSPDSLGHEQSMFTFSVNVTNFHLEKGEYKNGREWIFNISGDDWNINAEGVKFENFRDIGIISANYTDIGSPNISYNFRNVWFKNAGDFIAYSGNPTIRRIRRVVFENCRFDNGRIAIRDINEIDIKGCRFITNSYIYPDQTSTVFGNTNTYVFIQNCINLNFKNNIIAPDSVYDGKVAYSLKLSQTTDELVYQCYNICENVIFTTAYGISFSELGAEHYRLFRQKNYIIENNVIINTLANWFGISAPPGSIVENNVIYNTGSNDNPDGAGIWVWGVLDANKASSQGAQVRNNTIYTKEADNPAIRIGHASNGGYFNNIVLRNICYNGGIINHGGAADSYVQFNDIVNTDMLPNMTAFTNPLFLRRLYIY
jgi:hypothetical protein